MADPAVRLSFTRFNDLSCPFRYYMLNVLGIQENVQSFTQDGRMGHEICAEFIPRLARTGYSKSTNLFVDVFNNHTKYMPANRRDALGESLANWAEWFRLDERAYRHLVEHEMAVDRWGNPINMEEAVNPDGTGRVDCYTGICDYAAILIGDKKALLFDWKDGFQDFDFDAVGKSWQLMGYAYLLFKHFIDLEEIAATLYAPKYRRIASGTYTREVLLDRFDERMAEMWCRVDAIREQGTWHPEPHYANACGWCRLDCPAKKELLRRVG